jgi:hypothetical protein
MRWSYSGIARATTGNYGKKRIIVDFPWAIRVQSRHPPNKVAFALTIQVMKKHWNLWILAIARSQDSSAIPYFPATCTKQARLAQNRLISRFIDEDPAGLTRKQPVLSRPTPIGAPISAQISAV